jgi:hypothetical protein
MEKIVANLKNVWGKVVEVAKKVWTAVKNFFVTLVEKVKALFKK